MKKRPFAVFDIDGTLVRWQLYHAVVEALALEGKIPQSVCEKIDSARSTWKRRGAGSDGFRTYELILVEGYHEALEKLTPDDINHAIDTVYDMYHQQTYTYTRDLIVSLKEKGYLIFAISGSHQQIVSKLGKYYGFDDTIGADYQVVENEFTGVRISPAVHGKGPLVKKLVKQHDATWTGSLAIGDSRSDAAMLELVEQPIAFNPDQDLFAIAQKNGWPIVIERKNMIYRLEHHNESYQLTETNIN